MKLTEKIQRILLSRGINKVFGIVGREASSILFNETDDLELILTRHEFSAGVIAAGVARFTRTPQVCFSTLGPGSTNLATAIATANLDRLPIIAIAAQLESQSIVYNEAHQCVDGLSILKPLTKYSVEIDDPNDIDMVLESAFAASGSLPFGPSFVSIPIEMFSAQVDDNISINGLNKEVLQQSSDFYITLDRIAQIVGGSKQPIIVAGDAVLKNATAADAIKSFAEAVNIPVVTTYSAKGTLPSNHPLNYGVINSYADVILEYPVKQSLFGPPDLLFLIGYDLAEHHPFAWNVGEIKKVVALTPYESNLSNVVKPKPLYNAIGSIRDGLDYLLRHSIPKKQPYDISGIKDKIREAYGDTKKYLDGILPTQILSVLEDHLGDFILANDIGMHRHVSALFFQPKHSLDFVTSAGLSSFGTGLPFGIAAKIANPSRNVVVLSGDGGFHSNSGELETVVRLGLKIIIIVLNNNANGLIRRYQLVGSERKVNPTAVDYHPVNFAMLAEANGCKGFKIQNLDELKCALQKADINEGPTLIEVPVYYPDLYINPYSTSWHHTK